MFRLTFTFVLFIGLISCTNQEKTTSESDEVWVFIMAGQSNMAGRGEVEAQDQITNPRIIALDSSNQWVLAKEPLHYYEPSRRGLDCGLSFARNVLKHIPEEASIAILPCAVGGSTVEQWLGDSLHRNVNLLSNFKNKVAIGKSKGIIKGIIWHQGEGNTKANLIPEYQDRISTLFSNFREIVGNEKLPIILGELGSFEIPEEEKLRYQSINHIMHVYANGDPYSEVIATEDLDDKGDELHFNSSSLRIMGERYAKKFNALHHAQ